MHTGTIGGMKHVFCLQSMYTVYNIHVYKYTYSIQAHWQEWKKERKKSGGRGGIIKESCINMMNMLDIYI